VQLQTYVVAATVVAGVGDDAERPVVEREQNRCGIDIADVAEKCFAGVGAGGVDLDDVREATGWDLRVREPLEVTEPVTERELSELRALRVSAEDE
jgi:hypothetical protein